MNLFKNKKTIKIKGNLVIFDEPKISGIINITPDSFYPGSRANKMHDILAKTEQFINEGAEIIEIGGYSSRPGADDITEEEELNRILEPLIEIRKNFKDILLAIDTFRPFVAQKAIDAGADLINDITAGGQDEKMYEIISRYKVPYIIMHIQGTPKSMQIKPVYNNVVEEVLGFLAVRLKTLQSLGIPDIIIDPGFGFGKTVEQNYSMLKNLKLFKSLNVPVLVGLSRKSMIYKVLQTDPENALNGTTALNTIALLNGADILRVHDVKEASEIIRLFNYYRGFN